MRKNPTEDAQAEVLLMSRRRCTLCFGLRGDVREKEGQLAHVDRDPSNSSADNLCFLCLLHHNAYDTRRSQSKDLTAGELRRYREKLYSYLQDTPPGKDSAYVPTIGRPVETSPFFALIAASESHGVIDFHVRNEGAPVTCLSFDPRTQGLWVQQWRPSSLASGGVFRANIELSSPSIMECVFEMRVRDKGGLDGEIGSSPLLALNAGMGVWLSILANLFSFWKFLLCDKIKDKGSRSLPRPAFLPNFLV